ncbi:MAG: YqhA family protein [Epsilonproteobacteria bacterium]|nr:YqhA family protein [Campylobacterota bacterium]
MDKAHTSWIETIFESALWSTRFFVLLAVIFSLIGSISLFFIASADIWHIAHMVINHFLGHKAENIEELIVAKLIGSIDHYLIAIVLLIFSFGLYELFISKIDIAQRSAASRILEIHSLDELKDKLAKVIIMVLIVSFFKRALLIHMNDRYDMLSLAGSILALALAFYFMHKGGNSHE